MTNYNVWCRACNKDYVSAHKSPNCPKCGKPTKLLGERCNVGVINRFQSYQCPITGKAISSEAQHRDNLARHDCVEYDPEMKKDAAINRQRAWDELDAATDEFVSRKLAELPDETIAGMANLELNVGSE